MCDRKAVSAALISFGALVFMSGFVFEPASEERDMLCGIGAISLPVLFLVAALIAGEKRY